MLDKFVYIIIDIILNEFITVEYKKNNSHTHNNTIEI